MARPPLPNDGLSFTDDGDVLLKLKNIWANGTTHVRLTGTELIERLVSLVPRPRVNLVRYHGLFAPNARLRPTIVTANAGRADATDEPCSKKHGGRYFEWADLLTRVFEFDVTVCGRCGAHGMQVISCITQPDVIYDILTCIGEPTAPAKLDPAHLPESAYTDA